MTAMTSIQDKATEALSWFETALNHKDEDFTRTKEGAPEWVTELVQVAHGTFLPDDWRYDKIRDALEYIADADDPDESGDFADGAVTVYTNDRIAWLASNLNRASYCDEAIEEGLIDLKGGVIELIGAGQYMEASEIYALVLRALESL